MIILGGERAISYRDVYASQQVVEQSGYRLLVNYT